MAREIFVEYISDSGLVLPPSHPYHVVLFFSYTDRMIGIKLDMCELQLNARSPGYLYLRGFQIQRNAVR